MPYGLGDYRARPALEPRRRPSCRGCQPAAERLHGTDREESAFATVGSYQNPVTGPRSKSESMHGTVKFFNSEKGYGFISRDGDDDVFVHYSNIVGENYRTLDEGQKVEFDIGPGRKGDEALNVRPV